MAEMFKFSTPKRARKRSMVKCRFCRSKKTKCLPVDRLPSQKCNACEAGGQKCGPNVRFRDDEESTIRPMSKSPLTLQNSCPYLLAGSQFLSNPTKILHLKQCESSSDFCERNANARSYCQTPYHEPDETFTDAYLAANHGTGHAAWRKLRSSVLAKFLVLGNILDLCCHLFLRASVDARFTPPIRLPEYEDVSSAVTFILHRTTTKFEDHFQDIIDLLRDAPSTDLELFLRRLLDHAERYTSTYFEYNAGAKGGLENDLSRLKNMRIAVVRRLCQIYKDMGHISEANQYERQLAELSDLPPSHEASTFIEISKSMLETFRTMDFPHKYSMHLPSADTNLFPATHCAILSRRRFAAHFLQEWPDNNSKGHDILGRQALHLAAETSDFALLNIVFRQEPSLLHSRDIYHMTPICVAAHVGNYDFFLQLVHYGAQTLVKDISGRCLLCIAAGAGHTRIVEFLLAEGAEGENRHLGHDYGSNTQQLVCLALHLAAAAGHSAVVDIVLSHGGWPLYDLRGKLPSQEALDHGFSVLSERLQEAEAGRREEVMNTKLYADDLKTELPDPRDEPFIFGASSSNICQPQLSEFSFSAMSKSSMNNFDTQSPAHSESSTSSAGSKSNATRADTCFTSLSPRIDRLPPYDWIDSKDWHHCGAPAPFYSLDQLSYTFTPTIELPGASEANAIYVDWD